MKSKLLIVLFVSVIIIFVGLTFITSTADDPTVQKNTTLTIVQPVDSVVPKPAMPPNHDLLMQTKMLEDYLKNNPGDLEHLIMLGNLYFDLGRFDDAINPYLKALSIKPDLDDVRVDYAVSLFNTGKGDAAVKELEQVIQHNPKHQTAYYNLGVIHLHLKHSDKAKMYWEHVLHIDPDTELAKKAKISLAIIQ